MTTPTESGCYWVRKKPYHYLSTANDDNWQIICVSGIFPFFDAKHYGSSNSVDFLDRAIWGHKIEEPKG